MWENRHMHLLVPKATPNLVQPLKGHWLKEDPIRLGP